jgi:hypothetical protein
MAIFVALIFQVLFVAFAMAINIGLVVHDKINLQNSVDLAAYYAAQKQAEQLNAIAHQNYQIRQSFKLLAWRYNVLGSAGRDDHPTKRGGNSESVYEDAPTLCMSYNPLFAEVGRGAANENACRVQNFTVPEIRVPPVIAAFNPINILFAARVRSFIRQIGNICEDYGTYNYYMAAASLGAFRRDQANRKQIIRAIAANMAKATTEMIDLDGGIVFDGARKTFEKNLTFENRNNTESFSVFNSLEGSPPERWLNEIPIFTSLLYSDIFSASGGGSTCRTEIKQVNVLPRKQQLLGAQLIAELEQLVAGPPPGNINQLSLGYEKNPWMMVYSAVRGRTRPRQIFFPFGPSITFEATAYAQPFGGKIGPWYSSQWPRGAPSSSGTKVDALLPPLAANASSLSNSAEVLPNYSRFPGDRLGLKSFAAHAAIPSLNGLRGKFSDYAEIMDIGAGAPNDVMANDSTVPTGGFLRDVETAAISPDLFDATYYSIDTNFGEYYLPKLERIRGQLGLPSDVPLRGDMGSRAPNKIRFGVKEQILTLLGTGAGLPRVTSQAYWFIRDRAHLLTDWVHNDSFEIQERINMNRFGQCAQYDDDLNVKTPGSCIAGGRSGYSVKIVSGEYLKAQDLPLGGEGQTGGILNPPPESR